MTSLPTLATTLPLLLLLITTPSILSWEANWKSLDSRPLVRPGNRVNTAQIHALTSSHTRSLQPTWYEDAKFGIFIHWGVFSVPAFANEWFWCNWKQRSIPEYAEFVNLTENAARFAYPDYAHRFDATFYDSNLWANYFAKSGAQYVVLTSKHHEGYCNWDSRDIPATWNWNSMDVGPRRDLVGELSKSVKAATSPQTREPLHFGLYHSLLEWFNPAYLADKASNFTTTTFVDTKTMPELYDIVEKYEPDLIWSDGNWEATSEYWKSTEFLAWYATHSSVADTAVWNDRWGSECTCKHGGYLTCNDRYSPGKYVEKKWENALTVDATSWGWNRNASYADYLSTEYFVHLLVETVAFNGNMLLNVGPAADGTISPIFVDRLMGIGDWLTANGEAIYGTRPWKLKQNETSTLFYTRTSDTLYAITTRWPSKNRLILPTPQVSNDTTVTMLGYSSKTLLWKRLKGKLSGIIVKVPALTPDVVPCQYAWSFAVTKVGNLGDGQEASPTNHAEEIKVG